MQGLTGLSVIRAASRVTQTLARLLLVLFLAVVRYAITVLWRKWHQCDHLLTGRCGVITVRYCRGSHSCLVSARSSDCCLRRLLRRPLCFRRLAPRAPLKQRALDASPWGAGGGGGRPAEPLLRSHFGVASRAAGSTGTSKHLRHIFAPLCRLPRFFDRWVSSCRRKP